MSPGFDICLASILSGYAISTLVRFIAHISDPILPQYSVIISGAVDIVGMSS